jgi:hypothetical protein
LLDFYDKFIFPICNSTVFTALRKFNHVSVHTIESSVKLAELDAALGSIGIDEFCAKKDSFSTDQSFTKALRQVDVVMNGLSEQTASFQRKLSSGQRRILPVRFVPVPIPLSHWLPKTKPRDTLRVFLDWDSRNIGQLDSAETILRGIHEFRAAISNRSSSLDNKSQFRSGVDLIVSRDLPLSLQNITAWRNMTGSSRLYLGSPEFLGLLASCHVYSTAIKSSYENPVVEAQMGGAVILSTPNIVKPELYRAIHAIILPSPAEISSRLSSFFLSRSRSVALRAEAIHEWVVSRHSPRSFACAFIKAVSLVRMSKTVKKTPLEVKRAFPLCWT